MTAATLVVVLAFLAAFFAIVSINLAITDLFERDRRAMLKRMEDELITKQRERIRDAAMAQQKQELSDIAGEAFHDSAMQKKSLSERFAELLEQSGMQITTTRLISTSALIGGIVALLIGFLSTSAMAALVVGLTTASLPMLWVSWKRRKRLETLCSQLPDSMDLMARILRSGQTITQAMQSVATEFKPPIATEFSYCYEQQNLGLAPELALRDLARRTGLLEVKILVLSLIVQRQAGGNLADLLDKLANIVRERFKLRGQIKALTAEGRLQAVLLLGLPPVLFAMLMVIHREYALKLFDHPKMLIGTVISMAIGAFWIRKIVNFDF